MAIEEPQGRDRRLRVLLLLHELSRTGAPKIAIETLEMLQDRTQTVAIALSDGEMAATVSRFADLHILPEPTSLSPAKGLQGFMNRRADKRAKQAWAARFAAWKPDLIYANSVASLPIAHYVQLPDAPVLLHVHELDMFVDWYDRLDPWKTREWPSRYIAVADVVRDVLVKSLGISENKITRIPEFYDESALEISLAAQTFVEARSDGPLIVGGAGRIQWRKGFELWLQTAAYLKAKSGAHAVRFFWIGGENDLREAEMRTTAKKLGVDDIVTILPMTSDPYKHYIDFDLFLMTSWEDPFPIVVHETMAMGKPTVCVRGSGGPAEQVSETGVVVERFDPAELGEAISLLAANPEERNRLGTAARERAKRHFSKSIVVPQIWSAMEQTIAKP